MELLRIISMLMIVLFHANYWSLGPVEPEDLVTSPLPSLARMVIEQICVVGVNVFVLISGWFGIKPTVKGALNILYQVFFWGVLILLVGLALGLPVPVKDVIYATVGGGYYWFVIAYLGLYCLSPVLNAFVEKASPKTFMMVLAGFLILEFAFGWLTNLGSYISGYSIISFLGLYLLARFVNLHCPRLKELRTGTYFIIFAIATFIPVIGAVLGPRFLNHNFSPYDYSSLFVITASLALLLAFSRFQIKSKAINWIACSVFSVYLVHQHPMVSPYFKSFMEGAYAKMNVFSYFAFALGVALVILAVCVIVDKLRIFTWKKITQNY